MDSELYNVQLTKSIRKMQMRHTRNINKELLREAEREGLSEPGDEASD